MKGMAVFGKSLRFYFNKEYYLQNYMSVGTNLEKMNKLDSKVSRFGGTNVKNTVPIFTFEGMTEIYQIKNDGGIELYLAKSGGGAGAVIQVFGTTKEGKWVKYFDTRDGRKSFGIPLSLYNREFFTFGDEIIVQYDQSRDNTGELCYKWDEKNKWFGIENRTSEYFRKYLTTNSSEHFHMSVGSGLGLVVIKDNVITEKIDSGCIISSRAFVVDTNNGHYFVTCGSPSRYMYNFITKKIYRDKSTLNHPAKWEYINSDTQQSFFMIAEKVYRLVYGRDFFDKFTSSSTPRTRNRRNT